MDKVIPLETKFLIVDDEKYMRQLVVRMLTGLGLNRCSEAADGAEAFKMLEAEETPFNLVLLDIDMPEVNGYNCLKSIRSSNNDFVKNIPVVMLTSHSSPEALTHCVPLGLHGWIVKPSSIANLEKNVYRALTHGPIDPAKMKK